MHQKYYDDGFRVICITSGSAADAKQVLGVGDDHLWIGIDSEQTTLRRYAEQGSLPIPSFYLVDADGKVAKQEIPSADAVEEMLQLVFIPALGCDLAPELAEVRALYDVH